MSKNVEKEDGISQDAIHYCLQLQCHVWIQRRNSKRPKGDQYIREDLQGNFAKGTTFRIFFCVEHGYMDGYVAEFFCRVIIEFGTIVTL